MYNPGMPESPDIPNEIAINEARNKLGPIIEKARYFAGVTCLLNRGKRVAAIMPPEVGEMADRVGGPARLIELAEKGLASGADR